MWWSEQGLTVNSRERVLTALNHQEPDRIPFDVGGTLPTGVHVQAYTNLRRYLGLPEVKPQIQILVVQTAKLDEDFLERLDADARFVDRYLSTGEPIQYRDEGDYFAFTDEWGCDRRKYPSSTTMRTRVRTCSPFREVGMWIWTRRRRIHRCG